MTKMFVPMIDHIGSIPTYRAPATMDKIVRHAVTALDQVNLLYLSSIICFRKEPKLLYCYKIDPNVFNQMIGFFLTFNYSENYVTFKQIYKLEFE